MQSPLLKQSPDGPTMIPASLSGDEFYANRMLNGIFANIPEMMPPSRRGARPVVEFRERASYQSRAAQILPGTAKNSAEPITVAKIETSNIAEVTAAEADLESIQSESLEAIRTTNGNEEGAVEYRSALQVSVPMPASLDGPSDAECSAGLASGYIARSNAGDQLGIYLLSFPVRGLHKDEERTSILLHRCLKDSVEQMLETHNVQAASENRLGGWGWHSNQLQIEKRKRHCGTSDYAIYEKSASACNTPAAGSLSSPVRPSHRFLLRRFTLVKEYLRKSLPLAGLQCCPLRPNKPTL